MSILLRLGHLATMDFVDNTLDTLRLRAFANLRVDLIASLVGNSPDSIQWNDWNVNYPDWRLLVWRATIIYYVNVT